MNKKKEWIIYSIVLIQSFVINVIYAYSQINKWNLIEQMTLFIYPFYKILIISLSAISFLISAIYFVKKILKRKRFYVCIPLLISVVFFIIVHIFFGEEQLIDYNFYKYQAEREEVVRQILLGNLQPDNSGDINLPEELQNEEMARGGYVCYVTYLSRKGIYFCTFSGLLETSSGYMYLTDSVNGIDGSDEKIVVIKEYENGWYYCSTN